MSILHILNIADMALIAAGVAVSLLMMMVGPPDDDAKPDDTKSGKRR